MGKTLLRRALECQVRGIDPAKRQATFVASTERAVSMGPWSDPEVLRMKGARLKRYLKNPVLLDSHNRWGLDSVIGSCAVKVEGRELIAVATYAETDKGENAWKLVQGGHVRAMSIGYAVNPEKVTRLRKGEVDGEGESKVSGPASIVDEWELLEISNVPVPADEDAVRRSFYDSIRDRSKRPMGKNAEKVVRAEQARRSRIDYEAAVRGDASDETAADDERAEGEVTCPECSHSFTPERAADEGDADDKDEKPEPKEKAKAAPAGPAKRSNHGTLTVLRPGEALKRDILAVTPKVLHNVVEECFLSCYLEKKSLEQTGEAVREALKAAQAARFKPVGTPEPSKIEAEGDAERAGELPEVSDDVLVRSLESLSD